MSRKAKVKVKKIGSMLEQQTIDRFTGDVIVVFEDGFPKCLKKISTKVYLDNEPSNEGYLKKGALKNG